MKSFPFTTSSIAIFWKRRWARTVPLYALAVLYGFVMFGPPLTSLPFYVFFLEYSGMTFQYFPFEVAWSLCVEEWAYILIPIVFLISGSLSKSRSTLRAMIVLAYIVMWGARSYYVWNTSMDFYWVKGVTYLRLDAIMAGVLVAAFAPLIKPKLSLIMALAGFVFITLCAVFEQRLFKSHVYTSFGMPAYSLACAMLMPALKLWKSSGTGLLSRSVYFIAAISYPLYLIHFEFSRFYLPIAQAQKPLGSYAVVAMCIAASILLAYCAHRWIEIPIMAWRDRKYPGEHEVPTAPKVSLHLQDSAPTAKSVAL